MSNEKNNEAKNENNQDIHVNSQTVNITVKDSKIDLIDTIRVEKVKELLLRGVKYSFLRRNYLSTFKNSTVNELENVILPIAKQSLLQDAGKLEEIKLVERLKTVKRLNTKIIEVEKLITLEVKRYNQYVEQYATAFLGEGKQVSTSNVTKLFTVYIKLQEQLNKVLGLEEISINLIKSSVNRIPNLTDEELYSDIKKILSIRGYIDSGESGNTKPLP